jgi:hypothetical protein
VHLVFGSRAATSPSQPASQSGKASVISSKTKMDEEAAASNQYSVQISLLRESTKHPTQYSKPHSTQCVDFFCAAAFSDKLLTDHNSK